MHPFNLFDKILGFDNFPYQLSIINYQFSLVSSLLQDV